MIPLDAVLALRNIARNPIRNGLTALGVAVAVAAFAVTVSTAAACRGQIRDAVRKTSSDVTVQAAWARSPVSSAIPVADLDALARLDGVEAVTAVLIGRIRAPWSDSFTVVGVSSLDPLLGQMALTAGRPFDPARREMILGRLAAERLGYGAGNKMLLADGELLTISGIYSMGVGIMDGGAIMDLAAARRLTGRADTVNLALLRLGDPSLVPAVVRRIGERLPRLAAFPSGEMAAHVAELGAVDLFVWVLGGISLLACVLVVANTLTMAVAGRTREIGVLMAIGWSRSMVARAVVTEAVAVGAAAALVGNALAWLGLWLVARAAPIGVGALPAAVPLPVALASLAVAVVLGAVGALYPAALAARVLPARALRFE